MSQSAPETEQFICDGENLEDIGINASKMFKWNSKANCYVLCDRKKSIDLVKATLENTKHYFKGNFKGIWPDFDSRKHSISDFYLDDGYIALYEAIDDIPEKIKPGTYKYDVVSGLGYILEPIEFKTDAYIPLKIGVKGLEDDVRTFFSNREVYTDLDMKYRRAALIYGPPGNGKTFSIMRTAKELVETEECVVIMVDGTDGRSLHGAHSVGEALKGHKLLIIMEEITDSIKRDHSEFLNFLDGETSWVNSYTIATTNYPESLPPNVADRPGRFDFLFEVGNPEEDDRRAFLKKFMEVTDAVIRDTKGFSISYLREVILRSRLMGVEPEVTIKEMKEVKKRVNSKFRGEAGGQYV